MQISYYILPATEGFNVLREGKPQGLYPSKDRALEAATFMASIESTRTRATVSIFMEDAQRRMLQERVIRPEDHAVTATEGGPRVIRVGSEAVLA